MAGIATVAIPGFFGRDSVTLNNAAVLLAHDLRSAQNRAAFLGAPTIFSFEEDGQGYVVRSASGEPVRHPQAQHRFVRRYDVDGVFEGVTVKRAVFGGDPALTFDRYGLGHATGSIELEFEGSRRTVRYDAETHDIAVDGLERPWVDAGP